MKRAMIAAAMLLFARAGFAQVGDLHSFEVTAIGPEEPVLKYSLLYGYRDWRPGNAAVQYLVATELINDKFSKSIDDTYDAYDQKRGDFVQLEADMFRPSIYALLEMGGRCEDCDWELPIRDQGVMALLPELNESRTMATMLTLHAIAQARQGKVDDALATIRVGYELGRKTAHAPIIISGLVGVGICGLMNGATAEVMNQPESPNLYWPLVNLPRPMVSLSYSMEAEGAMISGSIPELATEHLDGLTADDWRAVVKRDGEISGADGANQEWRNPQKMADEVARDLPAAQADYAKRYGLTADQAAGLDAFKVVNTYWYQQYLNWEDEERAIFSLPYPMEFQRISPAISRFLKLRDAEPANPYLYLAGLSGRLAITYSRCDRTIAAFADVEAIRAYAADHDGALPAKLEDIVETPALDNPRTGKPFDYVVDGNLATISDSDAGAAGAAFPLNYTVRIRQ